ncbi:predicted protein [Candida tropicalis MYA-3404]|uniref:Uncharacterized protein n=1 Tax=Candida tropicalis (strain ATCC MYA-3404 / T1) TaxID=294747 RepID=C5MAV1_CANTT|nr:predicted protein [Candida tropicalis MYA-3404]EER32768.1 predicted protein [Candida tropicalis MYA-3404]KAG4406594.1 hypothetical protein JTP64_003978 [Candida tropicalis]
MPAIERLAMIQSQIEQDQRRYIPSFPYMSREERAKYDPEKFYKKTFNKLPPSPFLVHGLPRQDEQISLQQTSAKLPSSSPSSRLHSPTPPLSRVTSPDLTKTEKKLTLEELVIGFNKEKILCINQNSEKMEIKDTTILQENINDISEEKVSEEYDVVILNELGQKANLELSKFLKSIHEDVIVVIRDEQKPDSEDEKTSQYDYYVDLGNIVLETPENENSVS